MSSTRQGTILIIVAGLSALLASLALTFLTRMRSDVEESHALIQYAQAKIMLAAACSYVQETSRLGWDRRIKTPLNMAIPTVDSEIQTSDMRIHEEAYGWVDVRDGKEGPLNYAGDWLGGSGATAWPHIGGAVRCPMYRMVRPPWAIRQSTGYNLMKFDAAKPDLLWPLLKNPDPQPVTDNKYDASTGAANDGLFLTEFQEGNKSPVMSSAGKSWFRVYRDGLGTFIVTCGSGGTQGFKNWAEVQTLNETDLFGGPQGQSLFDGMRGSEIRLWYRIEWTGASMETSYHNLFHEIGNGKDMGGGPSGTPVDHYETWPPNSSHTWSSSRRTQTWAKNPVGTIRWIQRLMNEPTKW